MNKIKLLILNRSNLLAVLEFSFLLSVALFAPLFKNQFITGPLVNAVLFLATKGLGVEAGVLIGLIPSLIALSVGLLPLILAPMVPFIMVGNAILVIVFSKLKEKNFWLGIFLSSFLKFLFLSFTSAFLFDVFFKKELSQKIALMISWPQLFTALSGGVIAFLILKILKRI